MKKSILMKLVFMAIAATQLSGCVIRPWWGGHEHGHHHGEYHHEHHEEHGDRY